MAAGAANVSINLAGEDAGLGIEDLALEIEPLDGADQAAQRSGDPLKLLQPESLKPAATQRSRRNAGGGV